MLTRLNKRRNRNREITERAARRHAIYRDRLAFAIADALRQEGGIHKRLDEMRELFELMAIRDPEGARFLDKHSEVRSWLSSEDHFLSNLVEVARQVETEMEELEMEDAYPLPPGVPVRPKPHYSNWKKG